MPFEIIWTYNSKKDLKLLDRQIAKRIVEKVDALAEEETIFLEKVKGRDFYKFRAGDYRVFIDRFPVTKKLVILHVRHRKNAYKNI